MNLLHRIATAFILLFAWVALSPPVATAASLPDEEARFISDKQAIFEIISTIIAINEGFIIRVGIDNFSQASGGPFLITGAGVRTTFPSHFQVTPPTPPRGQCTIENNVLDCQIGDVNANESIAFDVTVTPTQAGDATITTTTTSNEFDPDLGNNTISRTVTVPPPSNRSYDDARELLTERVPQVCQEPERALAYLRFERLQPGDVVTPAFDADQSFTIGEEQYFGWIDCEPYASFGHLNSYVFIDYDIQGDVTDATGEQAWPLINGIDYPSEINIDLSSEELVYGEPLVPVSVNDLDTITTFAEPSGTSKGCALLVSGKWNEKKTWEEAAFDRDIQTAKDNFTNEALGPRLPEDRVFTLKNPKSTDLINFIFNSLPDDCDKLYFYYSGHGGSSGTLWLQDASLSLSNLAGALLVLDVELCIILDACFSGKAIEAFRNSTRLFDNKVTIVTASADDKVSYSDYVRLPDGSSVWVGAFSFHFFQCLGEGDADTDNSALVSLEEAYAWVVQVNPTFGIGNRNLVSVLEPQVFTYTPLAVAKSVLTNRAEPGDAFTYRITITNPDDGTTAKDIRLSDALPGRVDFVSATPSQGSCTPPADALSSLACNLGDIPPSTTVTIDVMVQATEAGDATNIAQVGNLSGIAEFVISEPPVFDLCGQKFIDTNGNGTRDPGEPGGDGFDIQLLDEGGTVIATTTTAGEDVNNDGVIDPTERGRFCFTGLSRGRYTVREVVPAGWQQTAPAAPGTYTVDLATGSQPRILFGNTPVQGEGLEGTKFWDLNGDGIRSANEPGLDGFTFELVNTDGQVVSTATSARSDRNDDGSIDLQTEAGRFTFGNVPPGTYTVREVAATGWTQTAPAANGTVTVTLPGAVEVLFGNTGEPTNTTVCGFKFFDANQNGIRDANEPGMDGVIIELLDSNGAVLAQAVTGSQDLNGDGVIDPLTEQGRYCFPNLPAGTYTLREKVPAGFTQTAPAAPGTYTFTVPSLELPDFDFGNYTDLSIDYGDLPEPCVAGGALGRHPTLAPLGAGHFFGGTPFLGAQIDGEPNGQPSIFAIGDDFAGLADEDGLLGIRATVGGNGALDMTLGATIPAPFFGAFVSGWIDINGDCQFNNAPFPAGELIFNGLPIVAPGGVLTTPQGVAQAMGIEPKALRLRISAFGVLPPTGLAIDGEVEDYFIDTDGEDYGDAPGALDPTRPDFPGGYPTTLAQNGARHAIDESFRLGDHIDPDFEVQGQFDALEDDMNQQLDDEDGIQLLDGFGTAIHPDAGLHATLRPGTTVNLLPLPSADGRLDAWIDWNRDGDWDDEGEQVFTSVDIGPEMDEDDALTIDVPSDAALGYTFVRFRLSKEGGLAPTGFAITGEVEDLLLEVAETINVANESSNEAPLTFQLHGNYPNPFNPTTTLHFDLPETAHVRIQVFNVLGQVVRTVVDEQRPAGQHAVRFDATDLPSGTYLYRMDASTFSQVRQMVLLK
ncbi:MAG: hypothetical protein RhofKO_07910 [Rhodothermales bacterium]